MDYEKLKLNNKENKTGLCKIKSGLWKIKTGQCKIKKECENCKTGLWKIKSGLWPSWAIVISPSISQNANHFDELTSYWLLFAKLRYIICGKVYSMYIKFQPLQLTELSNFPFYLRLYGVQSHSFEFKQTISPIFWNNSEVMHWTTKYSKWLTVKVKLISFRSQNSFSHWFRP